jgi:chitinase
MVGVTPMIGINDVQTEVFTLADAKTLAAFAKARRIGRVSMWQLGRDRQCARPVTSAQLDCSGVTQPAWQFSRTLG